MNFLFTVHLGFTLEQTVEEPKKMPIVNADEYVAHI
jgi:hypothetical protein